MYEHPTLPGMEGMEPQPQLPFESQPLTNAELMEELDSLHSSINEAERAGVYDGTADELYTTLEQEAISRGLMKV